MSEIPFQRFVEARRAYAPSLSPDGAALAFVSDLTGYPEACLFQGRDREPLMLTEFRERVDEILWTPDGRRLVLDTDLGGDERWAIRTVRPDGSDHRALSRDPEVIHLMGKVSPDGRWLSCATNHRDPAVFDLGVIDLETGVLRCLGGRDGSDLPGPISPDGRWIVVSRMYGSFRQELFLVCRETRVVHRLTPEGEWHRHLAPAFEPGGSSLLLLTDRDRDFLGLARLPFETREPEWLHAPDDRDVEGLALSADGRTALLATNVRGLSELLLHRVDTGETVPVDHPRGVVGGLSISADGSRAAFGLAHAASAPEVYTLDVAEGRVERATFSPREGLDEAEMVRPEEVRFASFDGTEIPGWLYVPPGFSGPRPAVVKVHGGPESQARPVYDPVVQYLLSLGFAVYEPNVRGSTGYGRAFAARDDKRLRFDAVRDLAECARFLREDGRVDGGKLSLLGGSYGGFMVLAGLAFFPDLWASGVDLCGLANFRTFLANTGPYRRDWRIAEYGDPEEDGEFLDSISPVHHADRIRAPLLVLQGANDPRVPPDEAEQIVRAVERHGGVARYLVFPDEGHGIVKLPNRLKAWEEVVRFLTEFGT